MRTFLYQSKEMVSSCSPLCEATTKVLEMCDEGILSWKDVAEAALRYMSEDAVADMAREYDWISDLEEDEPEEDEV